ncbi:EamA-like transporter family protein [Roseovarius albus]|uniref:EamA-like transporter family protein n=2 Tax=Roseovarius albus TaxID=1247867 RepID=A0A1X6Y7U7_9RHOB|nr:EamA-like transporter family protein [Roseovarius albus]
MPLSLSSSVNGKKITGMIMMAVAMLMVPGLDAVAKILMERLPPLQVTFGRFLVQTIVLLPLFMMVPKRRTPVVGHVLAGFFLGLALLSFNYALQVMPIANALAIFFVEPLVLTLLGAVLLRETLGFQRLGAIVIGLVGALIVLRPNLSTYGVTALFPLATAFLFSCYMLVTRRMSQSRDLLLLQFWTGFFSALVLLIAVGLKLHFAPDAQSYLTPNIRELWLFLLLGLLAGLGHQLIIRALSFIEAGVAAPFQYLEIVSAIFLGWVVFGDFPDMRTWAGTIIIVCAGLYVIRCELRQTQAVNVL